jgi:metal transporter CNNM
MSIDLSDLSLLRKTGTKQEKKYASKLYPLRKLGNLLLCSVLLANVLVNSTSTLIMGSYLDGLFAAIGSTFFIVVFGEIVPQAIFARFGLIVGYYTRHITYSLIYLTFVVSYPLGQILDLILGKEMGRTYNRDKLKELMRQVKERKQIEEKEFKFISGALDFKNKTVKDIMVPLKDVFSLDINSILDYDTFKVILYHGYSRMPVYEHTK